MTTAVATIRRLLHEEKGATVIDWMYPFLLVLILVAVTSERVGGQWQSPPFPLSFEVPSVSVIWSR